MEIKLDCRNYKGEKPCFYHKEYKVKCLNCKYYAREGKRILLIKLAAIGDVLRTTSVIEGIKEKYKNSYLIWLTKENAVEVLKENRYIDEILTVEDYQTLPRLQIEEFDIVVNLDNAVDSAAFASVANAEKKIGYGLNRRGAIYPFNKEATHWLEMAAFDDIKKANKKTYQQIMLEIIGLKPKRKDVILNLREEDLKFARLFAKRNNISDADTLIGINTGGGTRWRFKRWTREGYAGLIDILHKKTNAKIILFGGPDEDMLNRDILRRISGKAIDTGCHNSLREFAALINLCDLLVTGDSLALHIGVALKKYVIALFGPTSSAEVELYGRGKKIVPKMNCLCCYKPVCNKKPNCMENIKVKQVFDAIATRLSFDFAQDRRTE